MSGGTQTELVRPATRPGPARSWPLTPYDKFALQWLVQSAWVFDDRLAPDVVRQGLARLLDDYQILCGRITGGARIEYEEGCGVPFSIREMPNLGVGDLGPDFMKVKLFVDRRSRLRIRFGRAPLMTGRLTRLRDGWVLGVACSHCLFDGYGYFSMVSNWSLAARGLPYEKPLFDRPPETGTGRSKKEVIRSVEEAGWWKMSLWDGLRFALALPRLKERAFAGRLSAESLRRCRHALAAESGYEQLSTNSALVAHVTWCVAMLMGIRQQFCVSLVVDPRGRTPDIPENYAGNAGSVAMTPPIAPGASRGEIAASIHELLTPLIRRPATELTAVVALMEEVFHHRLAYSNIPTIGILGRRPSLLYTNSLAKFPIHEVDFGKPSRPARSVRAIPQNVGEPVLLWPAPPEAGGVELYVGGAFARAVKRLRPSDSWWRELRHFEPEAETGGDRS